MLSPFGQTWRTSCFHCWGFKQVTLSPPHLTGSRFHNKALEQVLKCNLAASSYLLSKQTSHCVGTGWVTLIWKGWARRASDLGPFRITKHLYMHTGMCVGKEPSLNLIGVSAHVTHWAYFISFSPLCAPASQLWSHKGTGVEFSTPRCQASSESFSFPIFRFEKLDF